MDLTPLTCSSLELFNFLASREPKVLRLALGNPVINEDHIVALLRNSSITVDIIDAIATNYDWLAAYRVVVSIVNCPKAPHQLALRLLQNLFWKDLLKTAENYRLNPRLRRSAENYLREKMRDLALGEKINLARTAPRSLIGSLLRERDKKVFDALLRNPHLIEEDLVRLINDQHTPAAVLRAVGIDQKWSLRYPIRVALVRNGNTPLSLALSFLSKLRKNDLHAMSSAPQVNELLRRTAARIVAGEY